MQPPAIAPSRSKSAEPGMQEGVYWAEKNEVKALFHDYRPTEIRSEAQSTV